MLEKLIYIILWFAIIFCFFAAFVIFSFPYEYEDSVGIKVFSGIVIILVFYISITAIGDMHETWANRYNRKIDSNIFS